MADHELVVVRTFPNKIDADLAHGALESSGIASFVSADDAGGVEPSLWTFGVRLLVRAEDLSKAREVLGPEDSA